MATTAGSVIPALLREQGRTQAELAAFIGVAASTLSLKISGGRPWFVDEANRALAFLRTGQPEGQQPLTLDEVFGEAGARLRLPMRYAQGPKNIPADTPVADEASTP